MPAGLSAQQALDRYYLEIRCKIIEIAASLDRIERGDGNDAIGQDPRMDLLTEAIGVLNTQATNRAERVLKTFSLPYDSQWRKNYGI